jgi:ubiquinone/menaquinone biosynthesis C-methylase UbiE
MTWEEAILWLRQQPGQGALIRECYFDDPLVDAAKRFFNSEEWNAVRELLPSRKGTVLDLGAGRGISSYAFAKDGWTVVALEPDSSALVGVQAIRMLTNLANLQIQIVQSKAKGLPFNDRLFDVVYCRQVLHHVEDLPGLCREIARVLKPGGVFLATREHVISRQEDKKAFLVSHPLHRLYEGENAYMLKTYKDSIYSAGLALRKV